MTFNLQLNPLVEVFPKLCMKLWVTSFLAKLKGIYPLKLPFSKRYFYSNLWITCSTTPSRAVMTW